MNKASTSLKNVTKIMQSLCSKNINIDSITEQKCDQIFLVEETRWDGHEVIVIFFSYPINCFWYDW